MNTEQLYSSFVNHQRKLKDIASIGALAQWDQEVYMPSGGSETRASQLATISALYHEQATSNKYLDLLNELNSKDDLSFEQQRNVEESLKDAKNATKFTAEFVQRRSRLISKAFQTWEKARKANDYSIYAPVLKEMVDLKKEEASLWGFIDHPYDAMLDQFEPGMKTKQVADVFDQVKAKLIPLIKEISNQPQVDESPLKGHFDKNKQWDFGLELLKDLGYNFDRGRQDLSTHPFTISFGSNDVRVTTRVKESDLDEMIWSCIHEGGHALYEQGLKEENYGLPLGEACSLSVHESQSRLYENNVGRSKAYWEKNFPLAQKYFPDTLKEVTLDQFYKAMNAVKPSFIRTSADELTYHFHVIIRFEIEKDLFEGSVKVEELDQVWNQKYKEYLGIEVSNPVEGILQDVHWSHGSFGYFPTYSLGSFYAAQFYSKAEVEIPQLSESIKEGNFEGLLTWLREGVHVHGRAFNSEELCERLTGEPLNIEYFMNYVKKKYRDIYQISLIES